MSDLRIGLVAEGPTDKIIIDAMLRSILRPNRHVLTPIQPEDRGNLGGFGETGSGWGGVYQWCRVYVSQGSPSLPFDLIVFHIDADVAGKQYSDANINSAPNHDLPCELPCPPAMDTVDALRSVVFRWFDIPNANSLPKKWVFCIPSKNTEAWIVAALYDPGPRSLECYKDWEAWLSQRPIAQGRLKKKTADYRKIAPKISENWHEVKKLCTTAKRFSSEVLEVLLRS